MREHKDKDGNVVEGHFKVSDEAREAIRAEHAEATEAAKQAADSRNAAEQARASSDAAEARLQPARESGDQTAIDAASAEANTANEAANQNSRRKPPGPKPQRAKRRARSTRSYATPSR